MIEIPAFMDRVENRDTLFQEVGCVSCAFDPPDLLCVIPVACRK